MPDLIKAGIKAAISGEADLASRWGSGRPRGDFAYVKVRSSGGPDRVWC